MQRTRTFSFDGTEQITLKPRKKKIKRSKKLKQKYPFDEYTSNSNTKRSKSATRTKGNTPTNNGKTHTRYQVNTQQICKSLKKVSRIKRRRKKSPSKRKLSKEDCKKEHRAKIQAITGPFTQNQQKKTNIFP